MTNFNLKIQHFEQTCLFELSWGRGQQINVTLPYPENLTVLYQEWQQAYLNYYKKSFRGRVEEIGSMTTPVDWHSKLSQAEAKLLSEFHKWLRSGELYEIRVAIANTQSTVHQSIVSVSPLVATGVQQSTVFLTCNTLELARLPWEVWEIGTEFALSSGKIRIVRTSINIRQSIKNQNHRRRDRMRVLAILGDETGLDFQAEKEAIQNLERKRIAEVEFVGWQPEKSIIELKTQIVDQIKSERGWDILFFAGHSNETTLTGGEIAIAPNVTISINEIAPALTIALEGGLQFALFNSCKGLSIANTLIDLGLSQVAVMREPIHNHVAKEFLLRFLQTLVNYQDVHEALLSACQYLKVEINLTYPSSFLVSSLFLHPEAELFCLKPFGFKQYIKKLIPTPKESVIIFTLLFTSSLLPIQQFLLERRVLVQAIYRQMTGQMDTHSTAPPVLLVQIDNESIQKAKISNPKPIDRKYLASLIDKLTVMQAKVIGVDYLLDRYQAENDQIIAKSIQAAVNSPNHTWFIFSNTHDNNGENLKVLPEIAHPNWSLEGEIEYLPGYMQLLPADFDISSSPDNSRLEPLPFSALLALAHQLQKVYSTQQPQLNSKQDFWQELKNYVQRPDKKQYTFLTSLRSYLQPMTAFSYALGQIWFHPILDFSIPANRVYQPLPAWELLEMKPDNYSFKDKVVIIAAGGYAEAGIIKDGEDNSELPLAAAFWQNNPQKTLLTGGEVHAYMVHHFLTQRLVVPIPDLWMVVVAIFLGKYLSYLIQRNLRCRLRGLLILSFATPGSPIFFGVRRKATQG